MRKAKPFVRVLNDDGGVLLTVTVSHSKPNEASSYISSSSSVFFSRVILMVT
jgi:hypothetical protein